MLHLPSLQSLRAFEAAARHQSYSRAAEELGLTHSAVSHRVRDLEQRLGTKLFGRAGGRMVPTERANELLGQTRAALAILAEAFRNPPRPPLARSKLVISVLPAFATRWLVPRLGSFRAAYPDIALSLVSEVALARIGRGGPDAAIRYGPGDWPTTAAEKVADERLFPVCSPDYQERNGLKTIEDLGRCVLLRHSWQAWAPWLHAAGASVRALDGPIYPDSNLLLEAACTVEGVALGRGMLVADALADGRLVRPFELSIPDSYGYFLVTQQPPGPEVEAFRLWLVPLMQKTSAFLQSR